MTIDLNALESCFKQDAIKESFENLYHCLGFITAIASSPDEIKPSEWIEQLIVTENKKPEFENKDQVATLTSNLIGWWNQCNLVFDEGDTLKLPEKLGLTQKFHPNKALKNFSSGYLRGFNWLTNSWMSALPEDSEEEHRTIMILNFILARFVDEKNMLKEDPELYQQLPDTQGCFKVLPSLISGVGMLGKDLALENEFQEAQDDISDIEIAFSEKTKAPYSNKYKTIGRNESCPCGSGKKFKKCCLH